MEEKFLGESSSFFDAAVSSASCCSNVDHNMSRVLQQPFNEECDSSFHILQVHIDIVVYFVQIEGIWAVVLNPLEHR